MKFEPLVEAKVRLARGEPPEGEAGIFGATIAPSEAALVLLPVPWDVTASYGKGAAAGPAAVVDASHQLDLEDVYYGAVYERGIAWDDELAAVVTALNARGYEVIEQEGVQGVNPLSFAVNERVKDSARGYLKEGKKVGVVGGEHSVPFGLITALGEQHSEFGILHIDAHFDLREAYEGFVHSHASIMYNVLREVPQVVQLTQIGIRDFSRDEADFARAHSGKLKTVFDLDLAREKASGKPFKTLAGEIVASLPDKVYVSFDIDGLDPALCPGTGTPVPGGLSFHEACFLLEELKLQEKEVIGFDLCEVAPSEASEWDANVGARILYKLCGAVLAR